MSDNEKPHQKFKKIRAIPTGMEPSPVQGENEKLEWCPNCKHGVGLHRAGCVICNCTLTIEQIDASPKGVEEAKNSTPEETFEEWSGDQNHVLSCEQLVIAFAKHYTASLRTQLEQAKKENERLQEQIETWKTAFAEREDWRTKFNDMAVGLGYAGWHYLESACEIAKRTETAESQLKQMAEKLRKTEDELSRIKYPDTTGGQNF